MIDLYGKVISEHFRHPRNRGPMDSPDAAHEDVNPLCGDRVRLQLRIEGGRVVAARFHAEACAVATAASSLLTGMVIGLTLESAAGLGDDDLLDALGVPLRPARVACARLPLQVLRGALAKWPGGEA